MVSHPNKERERGDGGRAGLLAPSCPPRGGASKPATPLGRPLPPGQPSGCGAKNDLSPAGGELRYKLFELSDEFRQPRRYGFPDDIQIDVKITVDQSVPDCADPVSGNFRMTLTKFS